MRQYDAFKARYPDHLLFFRMGDFYELFDADAVAVHKALGLTLTERSKGIKMAGVPYHSHESYVRRLLAQGFRVAKCDQVQDPREAKGIVERAVTQLYTPGTLVDEAMLEDGATNTLACVCFLDAGDEPTGRVAAATVELSTGAFTVFECAAGELVDELTRRAAKEVLYAEPAQGSTGGPPPRLARVVSALGLHATPRPSWHFRPAESLEALREHYGVATIAGYGLRDDDPCVRSAGAVLRYLRETQALDQADRATSEGFSSGTTGALTVRPRSLAHLSPPRRDESSGHLLIDAASLRSLEIERTMRGPEPSNGSRGAAIDGSLLSVFSTSRGCATPMGRRLLRDWMCRPLAERTAIEARHAAVATLVEDRRTGAALADAVDGVHDVARIGARMGLGRATPRDLVALGRSLARIDAMRAAIESAPALAGHARALAGARAALVPLSEEIERTCVDDPPAHLREGGLVRDGVDPALDEVRALRTSSGEWLAEYQKQLLERHDLPNLKVGYNRVFGFYIEIPAAQARRAPAEFTRRQTLKNAERFVTPELKEYEDKVLHAGERAVERELAIFNGLCAKAGALAPALAGFARTVAELDALLCFADHAHRRGWTRPTMSDDPVLEVEQGRHPVLEIRLGTEFVPNDLAIGGEGPALALITGPNMAGKSTYIRQAALITLLAHAGSFVPAQRATIGVTDRLFTRIGADDALHAGQSTFMVEMIETANILHHATRRSLVILDEIGRGTSTLDGLSLAWAIAERLGGLGSGDPGLKNSESDAVIGRIHPSPQTPVPRTLFATHYHELTDLADRAPERVKNLHVTVREWGEEVVFLHRIEKGRASRSYGIHVARLAGLPAEVVRRADGLLDSLSVSHDTGAIVSPAPARERPGQMALFTEYVDHPALTELKGLDLTRLSPLEAFDALRTLKQRLSEPGG